MESAVSGDEFVTGPVARGNRQVITRNSVRYRVKASLRCPNVRQVQVEISQRFDCP